MRPIFQPRLINGPLRDPCLRIDIVGEHRTLLCDLGMADPPGPGRVYAVSDVFVSHMHIDHFIGFDPLLRALVTRDAPLRIYGPEGITASVRGKLSGFTWNLAEEYPLPIEVIEVLPTTMFSTRFECRKKWAEERLWEKEFSGVLLDEPMFSVRAAILDHKIPCLAFALEEPFHINVNKKKLESKGLKTGKWLKQLKDKIRQRAPASTRIRLEYEEGASGPKTMALGCLRKEIILITTGQKLGYLVDAGHTPENRVKIIELMKGASILFSEAYFLDRDRRRAKKSGHLTATQTGMLARKAGVKQLRIFHFSPRYEQCQEQLYAEAEQAFQGG